MSAKFLCAFGSVWATTADSSKCPGQRSRAHEVNPHLLGAASMIQLTRVGTTFSGSPEDLDRLRSEFDRQHWIRLSKLLDPELLQLILHRIEQADFLQRTHKGVGVEVCMADKITWGLLHFVSNDPKLFQIIQEITRCGPIGCFDGRVYRMVPGEGHYDSWHDDLGNNRLMALSINMSAGVYTGGVLEMRDVESGRIIAEVANTGLGDGILFRLSERLEHRVTQVVGTVPKTAFAGWFRSQPDFHGILRERRSSLERQRIETPPDPLGRALARPD